MHDINHFFHLAFYSVLKKEKKENKNYKNYKCVRSNNVRFSVIFDNS